MTPERWQQVKAVFQQALERDTDERRQAEEFARKALEIDSELAEAHVMLGYVKHRNWDWAAEAEFKRAIELNPNYADAHIHYAQYLMSRTRVEEALAAAYRARELDPFSLDTSIARGFFLYNARRYPEAIEQLRRIIAMDPNSYTAHWYLGQAYGAHVIIVAWFKQKGAL